MARQKKISKNPQIVTKDARTEYEKNHVLIIETMARLIEESKGMRFPTNRAIAKATGLHHNTVCAHLKDYDWEIDKRKYKSLNDIVAMRNFQYALKEKNVSDRRLWMQLHGDLNEDNNQSTQNILIQQINKIDIKKLSDEQLEQISNGQYYEVFKTFGNEDEGGIRIEEAEINEPEQDGKKS